MLTTSKSGESGKAENANFFSQVVAMPHPINPREIVVQVIPNTGIPMRDYFAAKIAAGFASLDECGNGADDFTVMARDAYRLADAMLQARMDKHPAGIVDDDEPYSQHFGDYLDAK